MRLLTRSVAMTAISAVLLCACATDANKGQPVSTGKPLRLILVGDSTMATKSGYGDALCQRFKPDVTCLNLAKGGRSSGSYRAEGSWEVIQTLLKANAQYSQTVVLIQFGHNDQPGKPGRSTDLATEFPVNMTRYVEELKAAGAQAVLITPLTRRSFKGAQLQNDLRPWADASMAVATAQHVPLIDLNAISYRAVQTMGEAEADTLAMAPPPSSAMSVTPATTTTTATAATIATAATNNDTAKTERAGAARPLFDRTHLGSKCADFFSKMVLAELRVAIPSLDSSVRKEDK
ncbi:rhamnogalacturonan acetylesterase [Undibacterium sp. TJN19]|uniref:rhamnogalacturonan acetylesterase n=1 Tax=Undibacterium sp. TJN19 TaxID=3413055 RepID=UPI003BF2D43E